MRVRIGIADTDKLVDLDIEDVDVFRAELESAVAEGSVAWFADSKGRTVGIPGRNIAFVEVDDSDRAKAVGFAPMG